MSQIRALFEHSSDAVVLFDKNWKVIFCSASIERILGVRPEEILGSSAIEWVHPDDRMQAQKNYRYVLDHPGGNMAGRVRLRAQMVPGRSSKETSPISWMIPTSA